MKPALLLGLAAALVSCQGTPGKVGGSRPKAGDKGALTTPSTSPALPSESPRAAAPSNGPSPSSPVVQGDDSATLSLPMRLGFALPASVVGAEARDRLAGVGALVAPEGARLEVGPGGLLVSNHGGGIVSNNGGAIISNNSGGALAGAAASRRLLQLTEGSVQELFSDVRMPVWLSLLQIDAPDQVLEAYLKAGPRLNAWVAFEVKPQLLPPPKPSSLLKEFLASVIGPEGAWYFSGLLVREGTQLNLWVLRLPQKDAAPESGSVFFQLSNTPEGLFVARINTPAEVRAIFGQQAGSTRMSILPDGTFLLDSGTVMLPWDQQPPVGRAQSGQDQRLSERRKTLYRVKPSGVSELVVALAERSGLYRGKEGQGAYFFVRKFGFGGKGQTELGFATYITTTYGPVAEADPMPFFTKALMPGVTPPASFRYYDPLGDFIATPSAEMLQLQPQGAVGDDRVVPALPGDGERLDLLPELAPDPPPAAFLTTP